MDDVDAAHGQLARNMLKTGRLGDSAARRRGIHGKSAAALLDDRRELYHLWRA